MHPKLAARRLEVQDQRYDALSKAVHAMLLAIDSLVIEQDLACNEELDDVRAALYRVVSLVGASREELLDLAANFKRLGDLLHCTRLTSDNERTAVRDFSKP
jgi:hypothetical protein